MGDGVFVPASQRSLEERINLAASIVPVVFSTEDACNSLSEQTEVIQNSIKSLEENISENATVPPIYEQLEEALESGEEFSIQETLREFKEACRLATVV